jgi:hypothetical protein
MAPRRQSRRGCSGTIGSVDPPLRGQGQPGDRHQPVPRPGSHPAQEAAAVPLRDDIRQDPLCRDRNRARVPIAERDPMQCGVGD